MGKIFYRAKDPAKRQEYTLSDLKKRVRKVAAPVIKEKVVSEAV